MDSLLCQFTPDRMELAAGWRVASPDGACNTEKQRNQEEFYETSSSGLSLWRRALLLTREIRDELRHVADRTEDSICIVKFERCNTRTASGSNRQWLCQLEYASLTGSLVAWYRDYMRQYAEASAIYGTLCLTNRR